MNKRDQLFALLQKHKQLYQALMTANQHAWDLLHAEFATIEEFDAWHNAKCAKAAAQTDNKSVGTAYKNENT